jgi:hypothetical protein
VKSNLSLDGRVSKAPVNFIRVEGACMGHGTQGVGVKDRLGVLPDKNKRRRCDMVKTTDELYVVLFGALASVHRI